MVRALLSPGGAPLGAEQIIVSNCVDPYHKSPDSGERQYTSGPEKGRFNQVVVALLSPGGTPLGAEQTVSFYFVAHAATRAYPLGVGCRMWGAGCRV